MINRVGKKILMLGLVLGMFLMPSHLLCASPELDYVKIYKKKRINAQTELKKPFELNWVVHKPHNPSICPENFEHRSKLDSLTEK